MKKGLYILLLITAIAFMSCEKKKTSEPDDPNTIIPAAATLVLTQAQVNTISTVTADQVTFSGTAVTAAMLPAGKIIVCRPATAIPQGLLRKVVSATASGSQVIVTTTTATLEEIFTQADYTSVQSLRSSSVQTTRLLSPGVKFLEDERNPNLFRYSISRTFNQAEGITVSVYGNFDISPSLEFYFHKHKTDGITRLKYDLIADQSSSLSFDVNGVFNCVQDIDIIEQTLSPVVLDVGGVPVVITPRLVVSLTINANGEGAVHTSFTNSADYTTTLDYTKPTWTTDSVKDISYTYTSPTIAQPVNVVVGTGSRVTMLLYGVPGPYARGTGSINLTASNTAVPWWTLNGRFNSDAGADMTAIGAGNNYEELNIIDDLTQLAQGPDVTVADPIFDPAAGTYDGNQVISISCSTGGAEIRYTTNGSEPSTSSELYTAPLTLQNNATLKARAFRLHYRPSNIVTSTYIINPLPTVETPTFTPTPGTYPSAMSVSLSCATPGSEIRYTINGFEPNLSSALYTGPINIINSTVVKARGYKTGYNMSNVATGNYVISNVQTVSDPFINPPGGTYTGAQNVAISCATPNAVLKYTLDGSDPTEASTTYINPIVISSPTTLKAKGYKTGWEPSQIVTEVYQYTYYEAGHIDTPGDAKALAINGNYAYVADFSGGLRVINISNPASPVETGHCAVGTNLAYDVVVNGNYAYVAYDNHGLSIIDVSDPANPSEVGNLIPEGEVLGVAVSGNYAYLANLNHGLRVVNITNPASPVAIGLVNPAGTEDKVVINGNFAYLANRQQGMRVIDISNPNVPFEVGYYPAPGTTNDMAVSGNYAYAATTGGMRVVDISNPDLPAAAGFLSTTDVVFGIKVRGNTAFLANGMNGLQMVDISTPASPVIVGTFNTPDYAYDVCVVGNYAYIADGTSGVRIVFIGNRNLKQNVRH